MVPLKARGAFTYARRDLRAGQSFEASEKDAHILVTIGRASYETRAMTAQPEQTFTISIDASGTDACAVKRIEDAVKVVRRRGRPRKAKN